MAKEKWDQAAYNRKKIEEYGPNFVHDYSQDEWRPWTGNNYIKSHYDILLPDGTIIEHQWPNAGFIREFEGGDNIMVKLSDTHPCIKD